MAEQTEEIDGRIACITFAQPTMLRGFERKMSLPYPVYGDPGRESYRVFGLGHASGARVWLDPRVWARYASLIARGRRPERPDGEEDTLQLGGDAVLDAQGHLHWIYRSRGPEDRPPVEEIVAVTCKAAGRAV